jgi:hypothetical protein
MSSRLLAFVGLFLSIHSFSSYALANKTSLPAQPLHGSINNIQLHNFKAKWENKILTLYTGKDPSFEYGTQLVFFNLLKTSENQNIKVDAHKNFSSISIHVNSKEHKNIKGILQKGFSIQLTSGKEKDFRVPIRIRFQASGKLNINIAGSIILATSDLVSKNNVVDRSQDNLATIQYIAEDYVRLAYPNKKINFEFRSLSWVSHSAETAAKGKGKIQAGAYSAVFRIGNGKKQIKKMQLAKTKGIWKVVNVLKENQIQVAHKLTAPFRNEPPYVFEAIAAKHFEKNFYSQEGGWKIIKEPSYLSCGGAQVGKQKGYCEVAYGIYYKGNFKINGSYQHTKCTIKTYIFENKAGQWTIEKILPANKKFKGRTNEIIERKGDIWGC